MGRESRSRKRADHLRFEIVVPSLPEKIARVEAFVERRLKQVVPSEDDRDSIAIALTEVVSNAVYHGNKQDPSKDVRVAVDVEPGEVRIQIQDEGEGFDPDSLRDPLDPENLLRDSGRGIFILRALMDEVSFDFSKGGTLVTLVKKTVTRVK